MCDNPTLLADKLKQHLLMKMSVVEKDFSISGCISFIAIYLAQVSQVNLSGIGVSNFGSLGSNKEMQPAKCYRRALGDQLKQQFLIYELVSGCVHITHAQTSAT